MGTRKAPQHEEDGHAVAGDPRAQARLARRAEHVALWTPRLEPTPERALRRPGVLSRRQPAGQSDAALVRLVEAAVQLETDWHPLVVRVPGDVRSEDQAGHQGADPRPCGRGSSSCPPQRSATAWWATGVSWRSGRPIV